MRDGIAGGATIAEVGAALDGLKVEEVSAGLTSWARPAAPRRPTDPLRRRYCAGGWWPGTTERVLFNRAKVPTTRYRYRGAAIPAAWPVTG